MASSSPSNVKNVVSEYWEKRGRTSAPSRQEIASGVSANPDVIKPAAKETVVNVTGEAEKVRVLNEIGFKTYGQPGSKFAVVNVKSNAQPNAPQSQAKVFGPRIEVSYPTYSKTSEVAQPTIKGTREAMISERQRQEVAKSGKFGGIALYGTTFENGKLNLNPLGVTSVRQKSLGKEDISYVYEKKDFFGTEQIRKPITLEKKSTTFISRYPNDYVVTSTLESKKETPGKMTVDYKRKDMKDFLTLSQSVIPKYSYKVQSGALSKTLMESSSPFSMTENYAGGLGKQTLIQNNQLNIKPLVYYGENILGGYASARNRAYAESGIQVLANKPVIKQVGGLVYGGGKYLANRPEYVLNLNTGGVTDYKNVFSQESIGKRSEAVLNLESEQLIGAGLKKGGNLFTELKIKMGKAEYVPPETVFETNVAGEIIPFSTTGSVRSSVKSFEKGNTGVMTPVKSPKVPYYPQSVWDFATGKEIQVSHVSQQPVQKGFIAGGSSADVGLYVSPKGRASSYFTGLNPDAVYQSKFSIVPTIGEPTLSEVYGVKGVGRLRTSELNKGFDVSNEALLSRVGEKKAYITRRSELKFNPKLFTTEEYALNKKKIEMGQTSLATPEAEAIIPQGEILVGKKYADWQSNLRGFKKYTEYEGVKIPIREYTLGESPLKGGNLASKYESIEGLRKKAYESQDYYNKPYKTYPLSASSLSSKGYTTAALSSSSTSSSRNFLSSEGTLSSQSNLSKSQSSSSKMFSSQTSSQSLSQMSKSMSDAYKSSELISSSSASTSEVSETGKPKIPFVWGMVSFGEEAKRLGKSMLKARKFGYQQSFAVRLGGKTLGLGIKAPSLASRRKFSGFETRG